MGALATQDTSPSTVERAVGLFDIPGCKFSEISLIIKPGMKFEHWQMLMRILERTEQAIQWYIGDALNYGERNYGERFAQVVDAHKKTGIPVDVLRQYQWVADKVKPVTRVTELDWSIHREVASLPEDKQKEILQAGLAQKRAGKKYTRRQAEKDVARVKRAAKGEAEDVGRVLSAEAREFVDDYMAELARWSNKIPETLSESEREAIQKMVLTQGSDALWLRNRTPKTDYEAIVQLFSFDEGTPGMERAWGGDIKAWLEKCGYYMSDADLEERLDVMREKQMLDELTCEASRQEGRRGAINGLYKLNDDYAEQLETERDEKSKRVAT